MASSSPQTVDAKPHWMHMPVFGAHFAVRRELVVRSGASLLRGPDRQPHPAL